MRNHPSCEFEKGLFAELRRSEYPSERPETRVENCVASFEGVSIIARELVAVWARRCMLRIILHPCLCLVSIVW